MQGPCVCALHLHSPETILWKRQKAHKSRNVLQMWLSTSMSFHLLSALVSVCAIIENSVNFMFTEKDFSQNQ